MGHISELRHAEPTRAADEQPRVAAGATTGAANGDSGSTPSPRLTRAVRSGVGRVLAGLLAVAQAEDLADGEHHDLEVQAE